VVALSTEFGIPTPYTSYLALPEAERDRYLRGAAGRRRRTVRGGSALQPPVSSFERVRSRTEWEARRKSVPPPAARMAPPSAVGGKGVVDSAAAPTFDLQQTGEAAVRTAKSIAELKEAERPRGLAVRKVGGRTFEYWMGFWVDRAYKADMPTVEVKYLSDAYFKLLAAAPELKDVFALGERVVVVLDGKALVIQAEGKEQLSDEEVAELLGKDSD